MSQIDEINEIPKGATHKHDDLYYKEIDGKPYVYNPGLKKFTLSIYDSLESAFALPIADLSSNEMQSPTNIPQGATHFLNDGACDHFYQKLESQIYIHSFGKWNPIATQPEHSLLSKIPFDLQDPEELHVFGGINDENQQFDLFANVPGHMTIDSRSVMYGLIMANIVEGTNLCDLLHRRGYDLTTLKFSIKKSKKQ